MRRYIAPSPSLPQVHLSHIPKGYPGTKRTVKHMKSLIRQGAKDFYVRQKAIDILLQKGIKPKDYLGEIRTLFEWVQQKVRYTKDPLRVEMLHSARRMLELRAGDCDDMAILLGAMLEAIGHPVRLVLAGRDPRRPRLFTHVYLEVYHQGRWISLDPTMPHAMGWSPQTIVKKIVPIKRDVSMNPKHQELQGLDADTTNWIHKLILAIGSEGLQPGDGRVKKLWGLLKQRQLLGRSRWLQAVLPWLWKRGLKAGQRPRTRRRLERLLQRWGILPRLEAKPEAQRRMGSPSISSDGRRRVQPVVERSAPAKTWR